MPFSPIDAQMPSMGDNEVYGVVITHHIASLVFFRISMNSTVDHHFFQQTPILLLYVGMTFWQSEKMNELEQDSLLKEIRRKELRWFDT